MRKLPEFHKITEKDIEAVKQNISDIAGEDYDNIVYITGMDKALVGCHQTVDGIYVAVYDREMCLQCLADDFSKDCEPQDDPYEMAMEWFSFNTMGSLPYQHERAPIIIDLC